MYFIHQNRNNLRDNRVFPKVDHNLNDARIVLEQNKMTTIQYSYRCIGNRSTFYWLNATLTFKDQQSISKDYKVHSWSKYEFTKRFVLVGLNCTRWKLFVSNQMLTNKTTPRGSGYIYHFLWLTYIVKFWTCPPLENPGSVADFLLFLRITVQEINRKFYLGTYTTVPIIHYHT